VELSIYGFCPGTRLKDREKDPDFDAYVEDPYQFDDRPVYSRWLFDRAWDSGRSPGQNAEPIPGVSKFLPGGFGEIAKRYGYKYLFTAPSHFHVAKWFEAEKYFYADPGQEKVLRQFGEEIKRIKKELLTVGRKLTRQQQSWICVIQNLGSPTVGRADLIPVELRLHDLYWPQDNHRPEVLWMYLSLFDT